MENVVVVWTIIGLGDFLYNRLSKRLTKVLDELGYQPVEDQNTMWFIPVSAGSVVDTDALRDQIINELRNFDTSTTRELSLARSNKYPSIDNLKNLDFLKNHLAIHVLLVTKFSAF